MSLAAVGLSAVGSGIGALGGYQTSMRNAALSEQAAVQAKEAGRIESENRQREAEKATGRARARAGASGLALVGSPADVIAQIAAEGYQGARIAAYDGLVRGRNLESRAASQRAQGTGQLIQGGLQFGAIALTAASSNRFRQSSSGGG
jgi:hypothetical protein